MQGVIVIHSDRNRNQFVIPGIKCGMRAGTFLCKGVEKR